MWLFAFFLLVPVVEIGLFIQVGGWIGLWPTLALVVLMAILGSWLLRQQGLRALSDVQRSMQEMSDPSGPIAHGFLIILAGLLMITPGFFTDLIGLCLLIRPVRSWVLARAAGQVSVTLGQPGPGRRQPEADIIDGDFHEVEPDREQLPPSGWRRH